MKIRIQDDSIRLRLDRAEVDAVGRGEPVAGHTHFPRDRVFSYSLGVHEGPHVNATFHDHTISVVVPRSVAEHWASSDEVSIRSEENSAGISLNLLIEKDFECMEPRSGEDQSNRFPNPKAKF